MDKLRTEAEAALEAAIGEALAGRLAAGSGVALASAAEAEGGRSTRACSDDPPPNEVANGMAEAGRAVAVE